MKNYNTKFAETSQEIFKTKSGDMIDAEVVDNIQPTVELRQRLDVAVTYTLNNATSNVLLLTPTDRDFFIVHAIITHTQDATATCTLSRILATINGTAQGIIAIPSFTLTAMAPHTVDIHFDRPLKIDRGTNIFASHDTGVANVRSQMTIFGYYV